MSFFSALKSEAPDDGPILPPCEHELRCANCGKTHACGAPAIFMVVTAKPWHLDVARARHEGRIPGKVSDGAKDAVVRSVCSLHHGRTCS